MGFTEDNTSEKAGNRAVLYKRLSKEDMDKVNSGDESASIRNQELLLTDFAVREGFQIVDIYSDDDYSGLFDDRPDFERLIRDAQTGKFDVVIAKSQSRFTRNMEHLEKYIHNEFLTWGVRFIGVVDHIDTDVRGNKKARQINGLINEWYCEDLSENIRATFQAKRKKGQFLGSSAPYGYMKDPADHHRLVIDPYAAAVVRRIFDMYLSGLGKGKIAAVLSTEGVMIPSVYKREVLGQNYHNANEGMTTRLWTYQTVHQILKNEVYIGNMIQNKCATPSYKIRRKKALPKEQWVRVEGTHEPIIDTDTFQSAGRLLERKTRRLENTEKAGLFSGYLFCHDCGHSMARAYNKRGEFSGYVCKIYKRHGKSFCASHKVTEREVEDAVIHSLKSQARRLLRPEDIVELRQMKAAADVSLPFETHKEQWEQKLAEARRMKVRAYLDYASGLLDPEDYEVCREEIEKRTAQAQGRLEAIRRQEPAGVTGGGDWGKWVEAFLDYMNIERLSREMVVELVDRICIHADRQIDIHFKFREYGP